MTDNQVEIDRITQMYQAMIGTAKQFRPSGEELLTVLGLLVVAVHEGTYCEDCCRAAFEEWVVDNRGLFEVEERKLSS